MRLLVLCLLLGCSSATGESDAVPIVVAEPENIDTSPEPVAAVPVRKLKVLGAEWCGPCRKLHEQHGDHPDVEFVDIDQDPAEAARLWCGRSVGALRSVNGMPPALPCYVLTIDNEPVAWWSHTGRPWIDGMIQYATPEPAVELPEVGHAAPTDGSPIWCVRVLIERNDGFSAGSGVVVASKDGKSYLLTNRHVAEVQGKLRVKLAGEWRAAERVRYTTEADLYLLAVEGEFEAVPIAESVEPGAKIACHGFASGVVYRCQESVLEYDAVNGTHYAEAGSCGGESGGPVISEGELVGMIRAVTREANPDDGDGLFVSLEAIRKFLAQGGLL